MGSFMEGWILLEDGESRETVRMEGVFGSFHVLWRLYTCLFSYLSASSFFLSMTRCELPRVLIKRDLVPCSSGTEYSLGFLG